MPEPSQNSETKRKRETFDRSKIYEKLEYNPQPEGYDKKLPWIVQQQISATNGIHYKHLVGKLDDYPRYEIPVSASQGGLFLDIGCGWGRWLDAAATKGYIPVGIDLRLEFCRTARRTVSDNGSNGYTVVADLKELPFIDGVFDQAWSFSVIQHTHRERMMSCLRHINRILKSSGRVKLEFPNRNGIRNRIGPVRKFSYLAGDYNSWCVRYYTPAEYQRIFIEIFGNYAQEIHSFLGIGILEEDVKYLAGKEKMIAMVSRAMTGLCGILPFLAYFGDSLYCSAEKHFQNENDIASRQALEKFRAAHTTDPSDNLNIIHLLRCPISCGDLRLSEDRTKLVSQDASVYYPVVDHVPVMVAGEAQPL